MTKAPNATLRQLGQYIRHPGSSQKETAIFFAWVLLVLALADPLLLWAAELAWPRLFAWATGVDPGLRRWLVGLPPALLCLLTGAWCDFRRFQRGLSSR